MARRRSNVPGMGRVSLSSHMKRRGTGGEAGSYGDEDDNEEGEASFGQENPMPEHGKRRSIRAGVPLEKKMMRMRMKKRKCQESSRIRYSQLRRRYSVVELRRRSHLKEGRLMTMRSCCRLR